MNSEQNLRSRWQHVATFSTITDLKNALKRPDNENPCICGLRSVCWKIFLLFQGFDRSDWGHKLLASRNAYESLKTHCLRNIERRNDIDSGFDPLTEDEKSPWMTLRQDEALRAEIHQDVERCMPDYEYFHQQESQRVLLDILFVFCKLNPDVGYRQGMHEILAPFLWVIKEDAVSTGSSSTAGHEEQFVADILNGAYIEHDSFTLFNLLMQTLKPYYEVGSSVLNRAATTGIVQGDSIIMQSMNSVYNILLPKVDPELSERLHKMELVPQVFLLRWFRLLFGREFPLEQLLCLWDLILAEDPTLELIEFICVALLLRIRWHLLESDSTDVLAILLRYPIPPANIGVHTFVDDALHLRNHLNLEGGSFIITKYSGRAPKFLLNKQRAYLKAPQHHALTNKDKNESSLPIQSFNQRSAIPSVHQRGLENLLQDAARGVYKQSEKWGLSRAVRTTVEEMRKGVKNLPTGDSPRTLVPGVIQNGPHRQSLPERLQRPALENILQDVLIALQECDGDIAQINRNVSIKLRLAIDKVQQALDISNNSVRRREFYNDSENLEQLSSERNHTSESKAHPRPSNNQKHLTNNSPASYSTNLAIGADATHASSSTSISLEKGTADAQSGGYCEAGRSSLRHSSFSWMLEAEQRPSDAMGTTQLFHREGYEPTNKRPSFLFGEVGSEEAVEGQHGLQNEDLEIDQYKLHTWRRGKETS